MSKLFFVVIFISSSTMWSARGRTSPLASKIVDRIAGIVGSEPITLSEVEEALFLLQEQAGIKPDEREILNQLIEHRLLLIQAERETLEVKDEELDAGVENAILNVRGRFTSDEAYESELRRAGLTEDKLREKYRKEIRENLLIQKLFQKKFGRELQVSDIEAIDFYDSYKDSIPLMPDAIKFLGVDVYHKVTDTAKEVARKKAESILGRIKKGESFTELAKKYSDDRITGERGGDLGTLDTMDLAPEFRSAVAKMAKGEVELVSSGNVYHIVRCNDRYENLVMLSDIVIKIKPTQEDSLATKEIVEAVKKSLEVSAIHGLGIQNAKIISYGDGFIPLRETPFTELALIDVGKVYTFDTPLGVRVIKPLELRPEHMPTWEELRLELKEFVYQRKLQTHYEKLINKLKQEIFVKTML